MITATETLEDALIDWATNHYTDTNFEAYNIAEDFVQTVDWEHIVNEAKNRIERE